MIFPFPDGEIYISLESERYSVHLPAESNLYFTFGYNTDMGTERGFNQ